MKWTIKNAYGLYLRVVAEEPGTLLFSSSVKYATTFNCSKDQITGICDGLQLALGDVFEPIPSIHIQLPTHAKVDDLLQG